MSYLRDKTRPQGDRPIYYNQINFGGGLNTDIPATDINKNEVIGSENYVWDDRFGGGRSGSLEVGTLPGSGALHGKPLYHPKAKVLIFHRGTQIWRWDGAMAVELFDFPIFGGIAASIGENAESKLQRFNEDALLFTTSGVIYRLILRNNINKYFPINTWQPLDVIIVNDAAPSTNLNKPHKYKYAYTFSLIIDNNGGFFSSGDRKSSGARIMWESPPILSGTIADFSYYKFLEDANPIEAIYPVELRMGALDAARLSGGNWALGSVSHISFYRTVDLGQEGNNNEFSEQFGWVGDKGIVLNNPAITQLNDRMLDENVSSNFFTVNFKLTNINWVPFRFDNADSLTARVSDAFIFIASKNGEEVRYNQTAKQINIGFHFGGQAQRFNDGVNILADTPDVLTIACNNSTWICSLKSTISSGGIQTEHILDSWDEIDEDIGVQDIGSFIEVQEGAYIAICSDRSVRSWQGNGWSKDLALNTVGKMFIARAVVGRTTAVFTDDGAYIIWMDTNNVGYPDTCLRFSVKRSEGKGWTTYTGAKWIYPPSKWGAFRADDFLTTGGQGIDFTFVIDRVTNKIFWIETFNGPNGKSINGFGVLTYYADKVSLAAPDGFDIKCRVRHKEITGSRESFNIIHQESHAYLRDLTDPLKNPASQPISYPALKVDARAFVDGLLADVETAGAVEPGDDIQFWYRVEGSRVAIEFETNRSGHQIRRLDSRFRVQDILRPGRTPSENVSVTFQEDFQSGLKLWMFTRPSPYLDRVALQKISGNGVSTVLGPDKRNLGLNLNGNSTSPAPYIKSNTVVFDAFTYNIWIKTPVLSANAKAILLKINGIQPLTLILSQANIISSIEFGGAVTVNDPTTGAGNVNGWSQFIFVRVASAAIMNVYQNNTLKGTLPVNAAFGGGNIEIGGSI